MYFCLTEDSFRQLLMTVDKEQDRLRRDNSRLSEEIVERESLIVDMNNDRDRLSHRLQTAEKEIRMLRHKMSLYEHEKKELENEVCVNVCGLDGFKYCYKCSNIIQI